MTKPKCPYCGSADLKFIGVQDGIKFDLALYNCVNTKCKPYTIVGEKIPKIEKITC